MAGAATNEIMSAMGKLQRKLKSRVRSIARRGTLGLLNVSGMGQTFQAKTLADDVRDDVELMEPYGFTSAPPAGSEGVILNIGGDTAHPVGLNFGNRSTRPTGVLADEVAMYHLNGNVIAHRTDGSIEVTNASTQITLTATGMIQLGGPTATLGIARLTDTVAPSVAGAAWIASVVASLEAIGVLLENTVPGSPVVQVAIGTIPPAVPPVPDIGVISSASLVNTST